MNASAWNNTSTNTTAGQQSCCLYDNGTNTGPYKFPPLRTATALPFIISAFLLLIAVMSGFLNSLLLWSLVRVDRVILRAKTFLLNVIVANMSLPVVTWLYHLYFLVPFGTLQEEFLFCWGSTLWLMAVVLSLVQTLCAMGLTCDRIYAVAKPLHYRMFGYGKAGRVAIRMFPWLASVCIVIVFFIVTLQSPPKIGLPMFCIRMQETRFLIKRSGFLDAFHIVTHMASFLAYMSIFAILRYQRQDIMNKSATESKSNNLSLTTTYLLTNVTSLALYLPAPLYSVFVGGVVMESSLKDAQTTMFGLLALYMCNTCLDPVILISRIPSIRNNLPIKCKRKPRRAPPISGGVKGLIHAKKNVKMFNQNFDIKRFDVNKSID